MPFLWRISNDYPNELVGKYDRDNNDDRFLFRDCKSLAGRISSPTIKFNVSTEVLQRWDCLANDAQIPLVSERLIAILGGLCAGDFEPIRPLLVTRNGDIEGYHLLNLLRAVKGIDH